MSFSDQNPSAGRGGMSIEEAAEYIGVCRSSIYNEIGAGRLSARKRGKRTIILFEDARAYLLSLPKLDRREAA